MAVPVIGREAEVKVTYGFNDTISLALEKQVKNVVKMVRYSVFFAGQKVTRLPGSLQQFGAQMGNFKNVLSARELHKEIPAAYKTLYSAVTERSAKAAHAAVLGCGKCFNAVADVVELTAAFAPLNRAATVLVKNTNVWVTGTCAGLNSIKEMKAFAAADKACNPEQQTLSLIRLAMHASYVAFAAISISAMATGVAASAMTIISCLTAGTIFGLLSFFYEMMNDPYQKNYEYLLGRAQMVVA
jgi:hypothetical protein